MALSLSAAVESDVNRIVAIHKAAFGANPMLHVQFPTAFSYENFWIIVAEEVLRAIQDPDEAAFVVRDPNEIISYAIWNLPVLKSKESEEFLSRCPQGTNLVVLEEWIGKVDSAKLKVLGDTPCYCKSSRVPLIQH
ncbi:hypothetical protein MMC07_007549 [Pseudocyphellaria aurata]|nr:hypothetical protein [Pseudocyphellaria aurata]